MASPTNQRIAILVDSENLEISVSEHFEPSKSLQKTHSAYPDWMTIIPEVVDGRILVRNLYYKKRGITISQKFRAFWEGKMGGEIKQPTKSVDPYIIIDAITLSEKVDTVVLLAGDKDYLPLIWYLRSKGCKVEMAAFEDAASLEVKKYSDKFYLLDEYHTVVLERTGS